ncbi:hypothetical protein XENOCAPTIV_005761, partial [Xenoophorus captivus]
RKWRPRGALALSFLASSLSPHCLLFQVMKTEWLTETFSCCFPDPGRLAQASCELTLVGPEVKFDKILKNSPPPVVFVLLLLEFRSKAVA